MKFDDEWEAGYKKGKAEGIENGKIQMLVSIVNDNILPVKVAAEQAGMSEEEFLAIAAK